MDVVFSLPMRENSPARPLALSFPSSVPKSLFRVSVSWPVSVVGGLCGDVCISAVTVNPYPSYISTTLF